MTRKFPFPLILVLLAAWVFLTLNIGNPWVGHQDANGAWISVAVRNYHWHGFFALNGIIDQNPDIVGVVSPYLHHPPLAVWLFTLPTAFAGYGEAVIRFGAASCTLLSGAALYVLARRLAGRQFALWSAAFYLLTPMMMYFGRMPDHEAPALLFIILFAAVLVNWLRRPTRREWWALVVLTVLGAWTAWGALIVIGILGLMALVYTKRRAAVVMLGIVALAAVAALLGYYTYFYPNTGMDLIDAFVWRTSSTALDAEGETFAVGAYILRLLLRLITLYTPTVCVLGVIGAWYARRRGLLTGMVSALVAAGIAYVLVFRNAAYIHDYYLLYLAPGLALVAGAAPALLPSRAPRLLRPLVVSLIIATAPAA
ncbi:MAG: glycosyltransferase family 39 protein, partial [Anaerolineae bacterium]|nr:glycosyltransferase family 39 protein [Anaerolineae bacterium]